MNISELVSSIETELQTAERKWAEAKVEIESILDGAQAEQRSGLTQIEDQRVQTLFDVMDSARDAKASAKAKLERAKAVQAEDAELDRRSAERYPTSAASFTTRERIERADGSSRVVGSDEPDRWAYRDNGSSAVVDTSWSDHPVVREHAERQHATDQLALANGNLARQVRSITTSGASAIVPAQWSNEVIDLVRNKSVAFQAGARQVPMRNKVEYVARITQDPTAAFRAEGSPITASDPGYDQITFTAHTMSALTVVSREFLDDAIDMPGVLENAIAKAMALQLDKVIFFGGLASGSNDEGFDLPDTVNPVGILSYLEDNLSANVLGAGATNGTVQTDPASGNFYKDLQDAYYKPLRNNGTVTAMVSNVAMRQQYETQVDTLGNQLRMPAPLDRTPWLTTNAIPSFGHGTGTDLSDVFVGDFSEVMVGTRMGIEVEVLRERYAENGQIGILAYGRFDVQFAHPQELVVYRYLQAAA